MISPIPSTSNRWLCLVATILFVANPTATRSDSCVDDFYKVKNALEGLKATVEGFCGVGDPPENIVYAERPGPDSFSCNNLIRLKVKYKLPENGGGNISGSSGIVGGFLIGQDGASAAERTLLDWLVIGSRRLGAPILVGGVSLLCVAIGGTGSKAVAVIKARRAPWRGRSRLAGALE